MTDVFARQTQAFQKVCEFEISEKCEAFMVAAVALFNFLSVLAKAAPYNLLTGTNYKVAIHQLNIQTATISHMASDDLSADFGLKLPLNKAF